MDCRLTARHVKVTDELRDLVARRLTPLERLLGDTVVSPDMVLSSERNHYQTELVVHAGATTDCTVSATATAGRSPWAGPWTR